MDSVIENYLKFLEETQPNKIKEAIKFLSRQNKNSELKQKLRERIKNFFKYKDYSPLWAIIILDEMRDKDSVFELLDVLDSDEDLMVEAACDGLVHIEKAWSQSVIPEVFDFILQRVYFDPFYARISAYGILEPFIYQSSVKRFLIRMFEEDEESQDFIAGILVKTKDKRILELFKRGMEFAKQISDEFAFYEIKWAYFYLVQGKTFKDVYPNYKESWEMNWEERWDFIFKDLVKTKEEKKKEKKEAKKSLKKLEEKIQEMLY